MFRKTKTKRASVLLLCASFVLTASTIAAAAPLEFHSDIYGYTVRLPSGWRVVLQGHDFPMFYNYKSSESLGKNYIPRNGAEIRIMALSGFRRKISLADWVLETAQDSYGPACIFEQPGLVREGVRTATRLAFDYERVAGEELQHYECYFVRTQSDYFQIQLVSLKKDRDTPVLSRLLRSIAEQLISSIGRSSGQ